jgi:hypothetical protein
VCANVPTLVTYTFTVTADGDTPMANVVVTDPDCDSAIIGPLGDVGNDGILGLGEIWTYTCTRTINSPGPGPVNNTASVTSNGVADNGRIVTSVAYTDTANASVNINPAPPCNITGPTTVCEGTQDANYSGPAGLGSYLWSTTGGGCSVDGANNAQNVVIDFTIGACTIHLAVTNGPGCAAECSLPVAINPCPVCKEITPVGPAQPNCDSTGNQLTADVNNETPTTTYTWSVTDGPCVITGGQGTTTITYSVPGDCSVEVCCTFQLSVDDPNDNAPKSICEETLCCIPCTGGGEGRTPGFWKQAHHFGHWPDQWCAHASCGCTPTQFCAVFNCAGAGAGCTSAVNGAYAGKTLLDVLKQGGGGFKALGRHAVAGLLNSGVDPAILDYAFSTAEVIAMVNNAIATCQTQPAHGDLADNNELEGGSIGGQSFCTDLNLDGAVNNNDLTILLNNWGRSGMGDIDNNGVVGTNDVSILLSNWGTY